MANVWVGDDYFVTDIYSTNVVNVSEKDGNVAAEQYMVHLQRLPESSWPTITEVEFNTGFDSLSVGLRDDALISALLPKINTALSAYDSADTSVGHSTSSTVGYTRLA